MLADPMGARFERGAHSSRGVSLRGCGRVRWSAAASFGPSSEASSLSADSAGAAALAVDFRAVLSVGLGGAGAAVSKWRRLIAAPLARPPPLALAVPFPLGLPVGLPLPLPAPRPFAPRP